MTDPTKCPQCGGDLPANFPPGICPACLLKQGMSPNTMSNSVGAGIRSSRAGQRRNWTPPSPADLAPSFPQLEIIELLGHGGMGAVYKVRQRELGRWAALKILPDDVASDPNFAERFQREARALAQLSHQHIVVIYEFGQRNGIYYLLMEYVDGVTLRQASRAGQVTTTQALGIVTQICEALQFAHEEGVVHRDIKPENILIDKRGRVKIADFGLAKLLDKPIDVPSLTGTNQVMGTPVYMAPEQIEGTRGVDHRADIFSLGVVFYELLTGELPIGRFAPPSKKYSLDVRLDEVVLRTLEKEPDRRYQQASDVKHDVESIRSPAAAIQPAEQLWSINPRTILRGATFGLIIGLGTLLGLVVIVRINQWWTFERPQLSATAIMPPPDIHAAEPTELQKRDAIAHYQADVDRQMLTIRRNLEKQRIAEATQDPNEVYAIVQFTQDGVKLHPRFGIDQLNAAERAAVERIMTSTHQQYLAFEAGAVKRATTSNGTQVVTIGRREAEIAKLENEFWTNIDSAVSVPTQKFLRENLPLYADRRLKVTLVLKADPLPGSGSLGPAAAPSFGAPGSTGNMPGQGNAFQLGDAGIRYLQVLGWKQPQLPYRITIGRRGKWFTWRIEAVQGELASGMNFDFDEGFVPIEEADRGEAPELPSGLRRFWQEPATQPVIPANKQTDSLPQSEDTPEAAYARLQAASAAHQWRKLADCFTDEARAEYIVIWLLSTRKDAETSSKAFFKSVRKVAPKVDLRSAESQAKVTDALDGLCRNPPTKAESRAAASSLVNTLFADQAHDMFARIWEIEISRTPMPFVANYFGPMELQTSDQDQAVGTFSLQLIPPAFTEDTSPITFKRQGNQWKIDAIEDIDGLQKALAAAKSNATAASTNETPSVQAKPDRDLVMLLLDLDRLRAGDKTPWDQVEYQTDVLLERFTTPADKGRIHWQAAHVYGQSDIRGHADDVIRHAREALKYERDPVQRAWLYMYLGNANEVLDFDPKNFVRRREIATRWYLKQYAELLSYNLPDSAPELPSVDGKGDEPPTSGDGDVDPDQVAAEVRQAAQLKARKEAEVTRALIQHRDSCLGRLQDLYGRMHTMYDNESDAHAAFKRLATEHLSTPAARHPDLIDRITSQVFPEQP